VLLAGFPNRMRILQVITPSRIAGAERSTTSLCEHLVRAGHEVIIACKQGHPLIPVMQEVGLDVRGITISGKGNVPAAFRLIRLARQERIEVINTQLSTAAVWGSVAGRLAAIPTVATVRALNTRTVYTLADRVIAVSHAVKAHLVAQGMRPERIDVVYNGIDPDRYRFTFSREMWRGWPRQCGGWQATLICANAWVPLPRCGWPESLLSRPWWRALWRPTTGRWHSGDAKDGLPAPGRIRKETAMIRSLRVLIRTRRKKGQSRFQEREKARQRNSELWSEVLCDWDWDYIRVRVQQAGYYDLGSRRNLFAEMAETIRDTGGFAAALDEVAREQGLELAERPGSGWISSPSYILHPAVLGPQPSSSPEFSCPLPRTGRSVQRAG
jgi:glycosyltransferase involved in cell wall biosynthesis